MRFAVMAVMAGMFLANVQSNIKKPVVPVETFAHKYFLALDKTNMALAYYADEDCKSEKFPNAAETLAKQLQEFGKVYKSMPPNEDSITMAHEYEAYIGLITLTQSIQEDKENCLKDASLKGEK